MFNYKDQVVLITGASSGLGSDAAKAFASQKANLVLLARRGDRLQQAKESLEKEYGIEVLDIQCDVSDDAQNKMAVEKAIAKFGKIDVLINNAGLAISGGVETISEAEWDTIFDVNVKSIASLSKYVVPHMREKKYGRIINISSINGVIVDKDPSLWRHAYNATKAAVIGLTKAMAASYGVDGITVNAIGPGLFESEMTENTLFKHEQFMQTYKALTPLARAGAKGELNGPLLFFASKEASYVTGQLLLVDGGFSII